jgi:predicted house-cleaning noncanonical NTP pyrophosphatase (MazG superfamily)
MTLEKYGSNGGVESKEENLENKTESIASVPPDDQENLAKIYISNNEQKQVLVHHYTESKSILNDLKNQLNYDTMDQLKDRILEREKDVHNLQSRINAFDQSNEQILGQLSPETRDKYLKG